jgi:hypothetical protein
MPPTAPTYWVVRRAPYHRPTKEKKKGHVFAPPLLGLPLELWVKFIIPLVTNGTTSGLMRLRTVCLAWKELADAELKQRHNLLGIPVWLGNQPPFPLADFHLPAMAIMTSADLHIVEGWSQFIKSCPTKLPVEAYARHRKSPKGKEGVLGIPTNTQTVVVNLTLDRVPGIKEISPSDHLYDDLLTLPRKNDARMNPQTLVIWNEWTYRSTVLHVDRLIVIGGQFNTSDVTCTHLVLYQCTIRWERLASLIRGAATIFIDDCLISNFENAPICAQSTQLKEVKIGRVTFDFKERRKEGITALYCLSKAIMNADIIQCGQVHDEYLAEALRMPWKIPQIFHATGYSNATRIRESVDSLKASAREEQRRRVRELLTERQ